MITLNQKIELILTTNLKNKKINYKKINRSVILEQLHTVSSSFDNLFLKVSLKKMNYNESTVYLKTDNENLKLIKIPSKLKIQTYSIFYKNFMMLLKKYDRKSYHKKRHIKNLIKKTANNYHHIIEHNYGNENYIDIYEMSPYIETKIINKYFNDKIILSIVENEIDFLEKKIKDRESNKKDFLNTMMYEYELKTLSKYKSLKENILFNKIIENKKHKKIKSL